MHDIVRPHEVRLHLIPGLVFILVFAGANHPITSRIDNYIDPAACPYGALNDELYALAITNIANTAGDVWIEIVERRLVRSSFSDWEDGVTACERDADERTTEMTACSEDLAKVC